MGYRNIEKGITEDLSVIYQSHSPTRCRGIDPEHFHGQIPITKFQISDNQQSPNSKNRNEFKKFGYWSLFAFHPPLHPLKLWKKLSFGPARSGMKTGVQSVRNAIKTLDVLAHSASLRSPGWSLSR
jgi:hypothetical protein